MSVWSFVRPEVPRESARNAMDRCARTSPRSSPLTELNAGTCRCSAPERTPRITMETRVRRLHRKDESDLRSRQGNVYLDN